MSSTPQSLRPPPSPNPIQHAFLWVHADPRHYQLIMLTALIIVGMTVFELPITPIHITLTVMTSCLVQLLGQCLIEKRPLNAIDLRSALITAGSLCLLLRVSHPLWMIAAALIAIGSKYIFRWKQRHIFNPANLAITAMILLTGQGWLSPGQWGNTLLMMGFIWALGGWIIFRAQRSDTTLSFLFTYIILLFARTLWLGDPVSIPLHQLQSGALLIFAFLMISDPKTTPLHPTHRTLFGALVAILTVTIQWNFFRPDALMLALTLGSLTVPLFNNIATRNTPSFLPYPQPQGASLS